MEKGFEQTTIKKICQKGVVSCREEKNFRKIVLA